MFNWVKKGHIFKNNNSLLWSKTHATLPTPCVLSDDTLRIFYTSRDGNQKSRISFVDVDKNNLSIIKKSHTEPIMDVGNLGTFDDSGYTSSCIVPVEEKMMMYYNGYNIGMPARYRIAIGAACIDMEKGKAVRYFDGPIMDRSRFDPCGCATPFIEKEGGIYRMWYSTFYKWENIKGQIEPFYRISHATSIDGINWIPSGQICVDNRPTDGGTVRPSVIFYGQQYHMWFSYRGVSGYRDNKQTAYRIGYAFSEDGINWTRSDGEFNLDLSPNGWDSEMMAYPYVLKLPGKLIMLYVGNGFGQTGFGYAECCLAA